MELDNYHTQDFIFQISIRNVELINENKRDKVNILTTVTNQDAMVKIHIMVDILVWISLPYNIIPLIIIEDDFIYEIKSKNNKVLDILDNVFNYIVKN